jgi:hypothetical protein
MRALEARINNVPADCFICDKHRQGDAAPGGVLYEDDLVYAGHAYGSEGDPVYRGYLMDEPKRHARGLGDLSDDEAAAVGRLANCLARALKEAEGAEHVLHLCSVPGSRICTFTSRRARARHASTREPDSSNGRTHRG